ncbi:hypothetical protein B0H14DRAFT_3064678, partial [Mycena olivaceomarginata]
SILIDAPREKVWQVLLDFGSYKECRNQTLITEAGAALADQRPTPNTLMKIAPVHLPPTMGEPQLFGSHVAMVRITTIDHGKLPCSVGDCWRRPTEVALFAERWQMLTVEGGKTKYESIEVFSGFLAYVVRLFVGKNLVLGVKAMAEGLKTHSERA